jgi:hypothetical protein
MSLPTPGPWILNPRRSGGTIRINDVKCTRVIARVALRPDALLIAQAPAMLDALQMADRIVECVKRGSAAALHECIERYNVARIAIIGEVTRGDPL